MAFLSKKLSWWRLGSEDPQADKKKPSSETPRGSVYSGYYSQLSGLESQYCTSPLITARVNEDSSQTSPKKPHNPLSTACSTLSKFVRSRTAYWYQLPPERDHHEHLTLGQSKPEIPKTLIHRPSLMSSARSRISPFSSRARDLEAGVPESLTTLVPTTDEKPPKLDVEIPSLFLTESPSRPTTIGVSRMMARTKLPPPSTNFWPSPTRIPADQMPDKNIPSDLHAVSLDLEDPYIDKDGSHSRGISFVTSALELKPSLEPKKYYLGDDKGYVAEAESNAEKTDSDGFSPACLKPIVPVSAEAKSTSPCPHCSPIRFDSSALSTLRDPLGRRTSPERPSLPRTTSPKNGLKDLLPSSPEGIESKWCLPSQLLSADTYEADAESSGTSSELASMGSRAAWEQRKAERYSRYLEAMLGADTESDTSTRSSLKLSRSPMRISIENVETWRDGLEVGNATTGETKVQWKAELPFRALNSPKDTAKPATSMAGESKVDCKVGHSSPTSKYNSEVVDAWVTDLDMELPVAKPTTMGPSQSPTSDLRCDVGAIERRARDKLPTPQSVSAQYSFLPLGHTSENKGSPSHGTFDNSPMESTLPLADSPTFDLPIASKYTIMSISLTVEDLLAFKAKNPETSSSRSDSIDATVDSTSAQEAFQNVFVTTSAEQEAYQALGDAYNGMKASGLLDLGPPYLTRRPGASCKDAEIESALKDSRVLESPFSNSIDQSCALTTHSPSCSAPSPFPNLHVRSEHAYPSAKIVEALVAHDGTDIPLLGPENMGIKPSSSHSPDRTSESEKVLDAQKTYTATTIAVGLIPCMFLEDESLPEEYVEEMCTKQQHTPNPDEKAPHSPQSVNVTPQKTASLTASPLSLGSPLSPMSTKSPLSRRASRKERKAARCDGSPCSRSGSARIKNESPKPARKPEFGIKRFESAEVKHTAYAGYELDNELTHLFNQGSPTSTSTKSNTPICSPRDGGRKALCFAKDVEIISHDSASDRPSRSPSPKRPAKRMSSTETQKILQKELEDNAKKANNRLMNNLKLEDRKANALEDEDAHKVDRPRWLPPLSYDSKACVGHEH
ncbi:hypothetical protein OEA41_004003 [Lepraria neglecta]|uniref:Uncharacterized protein n=1 Tax=Lepraria neglecta TaxID=209136 RepID=A0AAD9Z5K1_9LECA|nr:hypothetical protein OEA41_004003 [Lepraria neglecta]